MIINTLNSINDNQNLQRHLRRKVNHYIKDPIRCNRAAKQKLNRDVRAARCIGTVDANAQPGLSSAAAKSTKAKDLHQETASDPTTAPRDLKRNN